MVSLFFLPPSLLVEPLKASTFHCVTSRRHVNDKHTHTDINSPPFLQRWLVDVPPEKHASIVPAPCCCWYRDSGRREGDGGQITVTMMERELTRLAAVSRSVAVGGFRGSGDSLGRNVGGEASPFLCPPWAGLAPRVRGWMSLGSLPLPFFLSSRLRRPAVLRSRALRQPRLPRPRWLSNGRSTLSLTPKSTNKQNKIY